jgi:hypothetical protein
VRSIVTGGTALVKQAQPAEEQRRRFPVIRRALRLGLRFLFVAGCIAGLVTLVRRRSAQLPFDDGNDAWPSRASGSEPATPSPRLAGVPPLAAWVDPIGRDCPPTHPVKVKLSSNIFHVPGGMNYERTVPDRCYRDEAAAIADGFVRSKR